MSLIHWWPLNGNLNDYGVKNVALINSGATLNNNGKIGKCYSFDGNDDYLSMSSQDIFNCFKGGSTPFSLALWIYNGETSGFRAIIFGDYNTTGSINFNIELNGNQTNNGIRFYWAGSPDWAASNSIITPNQWSHLVITYDGSKISIYVNGILKDTRNGTLGEKNKTSGYFYLGRDSRTGATAFSGRMNDVRIYDHALSLKEVKEISKGLVLHYNFEDSCNPNLLINSGNYTVLNKATSSLPNKDGVKFWPIYFNSLENNVTYTLSVDFDGTLSATHKTNGSANPADRLCAVWLYFRTNPYSDSNYSSYDKPIIFTSANYNHKQISPTRHQWTFTLGSGITYYPCCSTRTNTYSDGSTTVTVHFWNFKLEKSDTSTPFISNTETISKVYDSSGYGYNGTINGDLQIVGDSGCGEHSFKNNTNTNATYIECPTSLTFLTNCTICCWYKKKTATESMLLCDRSTGYYVAAMDSSQNFWHGNAGSPTMYVDGVPANKPPYDTNWHFYCASGVNLSAWNKLYLGYHSDTFTYHGQCSDFKIYATALSASDILAEYQRKAAIDRNGNLYSGQFIENGNSEELLWTQVAADAISYRQSGSADRITTDSDGSVVFTTKVWAKSPMIPVTAGERLYYDITYSNVSGNQFYVGFEQYNANGGSGSNEGCVYVISGDTSARDHYRVKGYITVSATANSSPTTQIRLRILNDWSSTSNTHIAKIHSISLRRISSIASPKIIKTSCFIANDFRENNYNGKVSEYANGFVESTELIEN